MTWVLPGRSQHGSCEARRALVGPNFRELRRMVNSSYWVKQCQGRLGKGPSPGSWASAPRPPSRATSSAAARRTRSRPPGAGKRRTSTRRSVWRVACTWCRRFAEMRRRAGAAADRQADSGHAQRRPARRRAPVRSRSARPAGRDRSHALARASRNPARGAGASARRCAAPAAGGADLRDGGAGGAVNRRCRRTDHAGRARR